MFFVFVSQYLFIFSFHSDIFSFFLNIFQFLCSFSFIFPCFPNIFQLLCRRKCSSCRRRTHDSQDSSRRTGQCAKSLISSSTLSSSFPPHNNHLTCLLSHKATDAAQRNSQILCKSRSARNIAKNHNFQMSERNRVPRRP